LSTWQTSPFLPEPVPDDRHHAFFFPAAFALAALFLLLRIMTILRKDPTTADPKRIRMTGIRMAQTRGGKMF
jgi:predicted small integral membrane protein